MALSTKTNQIAGGSSTGNTATTDPGFQPKGLITWAGLQTSAGAVANAHFSIGVASSNTTERSAAFSSLDNAASSDIARNFRTGDILRNDTAGTATANIAASFTSFDATGFTLNWGALTTSSPLFNYLAIGGDDITNVNSGHFVSNTSTGNQAVTGVGFEPDFVLLFANLSTANSAANNNSNSGMGVMDANGNQWSMAWKGANSQATMNTSRGFSNTRCFIMPNTANNNLFQEMSFVSMDSDGFTVNLDVAGGTSILIGYIAFKGGQWKVGTETQKASTGTKATTGVGFQPQGVLFGSVCDTQIAGTADHARWLLGATTGTSNNVSLWTGDTDNVADSIANTIMSNSKCIVLATEGASATPTINAEADLDSFDSDGFTLDWTTADTTERVFGYVAFAGNATVSTGGKIKVYNGSSWVEKPVKVWNGSSWVEKPLKRYNGSAWVET